MESNRSAETCDVCQQPHRTEDCHYVAARARRDAARTSKERLQEAEMLLGMLYTDMNRCDFLDVKRNWVARIAAFMDGKAASYTPDETPVTLSPDGTQLGRWKQGFPEDCPVCDGMDPNCGQPCTPSPAPALPGVRDVMQLMTAASAPPHCPTCSCGAVPRNDAL